MIVSSLTPEWLPAELVLFSPLPLVVGMVSGAKRHKP